jgi:hypothetical protein
VGTAPAPVPERFTSTFRHIPRDESRHSQMQSAPAMIKAITLTIIGT